MAALTINLNSISNLSHSQFRQIAHDNPDMKLERNKQENLIVMAPTGGETGSFNADLNGQLYVWNRTSRGKIFDSSTGFELPEGEDRSPDLAWIKIDKWEALTPGERLSAWLAARSERQTRCDLSNWATTRTFDCSRFTIGGRSITRICAGC